VLQRSQQGVAKKRQLRLLAAVCSLLWAPLSYAGDDLSFIAGGEWQLIHPLLGLGGGGLNVGDVSGGVWQTDLIIGVEHQRTMGALGGLLKMDLSFFDDQDPVGGVQVYRYDMSLMATCSTRGDNVKPFVRVGAGPMVTWSWVNGRDAASGLGAQAEVAAGWKSVAEIYLNTRLSDDAFGPSFGVSAGARVHVLLLLAVLASAS
jgi:hypothetical protein